MFFSSECWQISPSLFCFSFALSAFHYYNFFYILFQRTVWNSGKSITYCCDTGLLALWNRKMHFPRVTFCLKFKLLEFQEGVGAWVGYTSMSNTNTANLRMLVLFCIVPIPIFQLLPQQDFFFDFLMFRFPLHPPPSIGFSLLSVLSSHFSFSPKNTFYFNIFILGFFIWTF